MSDQLIVNINTSETNIPSSVTHRGATGDTHNSSPNIINATAANDDTDNTSDRHGQTPIADLEIQRTSFMLLLIAILLLLIAFIVTVNLPEPSTVPVVNLLKAVQVTSRVLYFYGAFLVLLALCRTREASVACVIYQRTFLWASLPLAAVVVGLKVAVSVVSQLH